MRIDRVKTNSSPTMRAGRGARGRFAGDGFARAERGSRCPRRPPATCARGRRADGYRPNRIAQNLRRQRAETIGVVVPDIAESALQRGRKRVRAARVLRRVTGSSFAAPTKRWRSSAHICRRSPTSESLGVIVAPADSRGSGLDAPVRTRDPGRRFRPLGARRARRHRPLRQHRRDTQGDGAPDLARPQAHRLRRRPPRPRDGRGAARRLHRGDAHGGSHAVRRRRRLPRPTSPSARRRRCSQSQIARPRSSSATT